jgi:hypothetical protein
MKKYNNNDSYFALKAQNEDNPERYNKILRFNIECIIFVNKTSCTTHCFSNKGFILKSKAIPHGLKKYSTNDLTNLCFFYA